MEKHMLTVGRITSFILLLVIIMNIAEGAIAVLSNNQLSISSFFIGWIGFFIQTLVILGISKK